MRTVIVGGGMMGLCTAMLLANDDHEVTLLERDPSPPPDPLDAFDRWERRGVTQFRLAHLFLSRFRAIAESELPLLVETITSAGALRYNVLANIPDELKGGSRPDDDRFDLITGRRAMMEAAAGRLCEDTKNVTVRRGVAVQAVTTGPSDRNGVPHVAGVRLDSDEIIPADLVVDAGGRRSALPRWLSEVGARPVDEELEDSGFIYYGRHFRSADGQMPPILGPLKQEWGTIGVLTLPADNGTWSVTLTSSSKDTALRALRDPDNWAKVNQLLPLTAHWIDAEPIDDGVSIMARIEDRIRDYSPGGAPIATGVVAVADAWSCTNPSLGRGASVGLMHAVCLRDHLREAGDPWQMARSWAEVTHETVEPWYRITLAYDRHRLAEIHALMEGRPYTTDDDFWHLNRALETSSATSSAMDEGDRLRALLEIAMALRLPDEIFGDPARRETILAEAAAAAAAEEANIGPDRVQLLAALST